MKILFLSRYQNTVERGAEVFVTELASRISRKHHVRILYGQEADSLQEVLKNKYDIVIPINGRLQSLKVSMGRLIGGYKVLIAGQSGIGWDDIWNIVVAKPDVFVGLTDYMTDWARKWAWGSQVLKIHHGVDLQKYTTSGKKIQINLPRPIILSVGALVWYKYHNKVIDAMARMNKGSLLIVGQGPLRNELTKQAEQKIKGRFLITSYKNKDMPEVYRSCDLFTLPSWDREGFGLVYLEALASGLPVVAPDDKTRREIIQDGGILVNTQDPTMYAQALEEALGREWNNKPRKQAEKFSWEETAKEYEKIMESLVKKDNKDL